MQGLGVFGIDFSVPQTMTFLLSGSGLALQRGARTELRYLINLVGILVRGANPTGL